MFDKNELAIDSLAPANGMGRPQWTSYTVREKTP